MAPHLQRRRIFLMWLLVGLAILPIFYLNFTAIRSADDYGYSTFWMNGPAEFWRLTVRHYNVTNGRALVHFIAQTVLAFPPIVFAAVNTALLSGAALLAGQIQGAVKRSLSWTVFFFLTLLLLLPVSILTEGLLWASASYNYMLPVFLTMLALWFLSQFLVQGRKNPLFLLCFLLSQFAAGATTEQSGIMVIAATGLYGLCWSIQERKGWWKLLLAPLLAAAGWSTIFLSPATQRRAEAGVRLDFDTLLSRLERMGTLYLSWDGILLPLLVAVVLLAACLLIPETRKSLNRGTLALLSGAVAASFVMLPTGNFDPRTMLPPALCLLLISARCAALLMERLGKPTSALCGGLTLALCAAACFPLLSGATENYALELRNRAAIRESQITGEVHYCIDYNTRWCYRQLWHTDNNYYLNFLKANHLTDRRFYIESAGMLPVYLNGERLSSPGYIQDGKVFFALRDVIEGFGGTVEYDHGAYLVKLDGQNVNISSALIANYWPDGIYTEYDMGAHSVNGYCKASYTAEAYKAIFGIDIVLSGNRYVCSKVT